MSRVPDMKNFGEGQSPHQGAWSFCAYCGEKIAFEAQHCPSCGAPTVRSTLPKDAISSKSYGIAVSLCGIFGVMGIHHFYIGKWAHGFFDLGLFISWMVLWIAGGSVSAMMLAAVLFAVDVIHTVYVFYRLITGQKTDGDGKVITHQLS